VRFWSVTHILCSCAIVALVWYLYVQVSPKAGNMNAAMFPIDYPDREPLIGDSTIVVVNDVR
jgi:hypothetical protein